MLHDTKAVGEPAPRRRGQVSEARVTEAIAARRVTLTVPRSEDGYWTLLRYLDTRGGFAIADALRRIDDAETRADLIGYVTALQKAGYLAPMVDGGLLLRIAKPQVEAPRLTRTGKPRILATRQAHLWRAMKMIGFFTLPDLVSAVSCEGDVIGLDLAERYVEDLAAAGYLMARRNEHSGQIVYRLKASMNTGPAAPQVLRARFVWDPNTLRVVGDAVAVGEVRR